MLNLPELEKRWLHYKIKSYIPHTIIAISSVIIIIILITFQNITHTEQDNTTKIKTNKVTSTPVKPIPTPKPIVKKEIIKITPLTTKPIEHNIAKLKPSLDFMKKMQHSTQPYYQNDVITQPKIVANEPEVQVVETVEVEEEPVYEEKKISIKRQNTQNDIHEIIARFKKNNNPALSLFVAKKYYELGDYHKSYNYALITNRINRDIEASWIIFAKSLVKLNEKEMAIKTLTEYIKTSHSSSAKILLDEITSGKFK